MYDLLVNAVHIHSYVDAYKLAESKQFVTSTRNPLSRFTSAMSLLVSTSDIPLRRLVLRAFSNRPSQSGHPTQLHEITPGPATLGHQPRARRDFYRHKNSESNVYAQPPRSRSAQQQKEYIRGQELLAKSPYRAYKNPATKFSFDEFIARNEQLVWYSSPGALAERRLKQQVRERQRGDPVSQPQAPSFVPYVHRRVNYSRFQGC
jgi:hypothetical protein